MNERVLTYLLQIYALLSSLDKDTPIQVKSNVIELYLNKLHFTNSLIQKYIEIFKIFHEPYISIPNNNLNEQGIPYSELKTLCESVSSKLSKKHRFLILINLIQFLEFVPDFSNNKILEKGINAIAGIFRVNETELANFQAFITGNLHNLQKKENLLIIDGKNSSFISGIKHFKKEGLKGQLFVLNVEWYETFLIRYIGPEEVLINNTKLPNNQIELVEVGSSIHATNTSPIFYNDLSNQFKEYAITRQVKLEAKEIEYTFHNSDQGIKPLCLTAQSGDLIAVIGGSGTGKTTLMNILNGKLTPQKGVVKINDNNIQTEVAKITGLMGYVPQDDLLFEELTVYQNLLFTAQLSLGNISSIEIDLVVDSVLEELKLLDIKNLKVGNPLNKLISGGQRKRINIALELLREPSILFVDEPTSGLSSKDSENIIQILRNHAQKGNLVIINIHQPSGFLFRLFTKILVLDKGGYLAYFGNPIESLSYFRTKIGTAGQGLTGNQLLEHLHPGQILEYLEEKIVDEYGEYTNQRKISPKEWYLYFKEEYASQFSHDKTELQTKVLPENLFSPPGNLMQFMIFFKRNYLSKLRDRQYLFINTLIAPALALILSMFSKQYTNSIYIFNKNSNIPAFLFMSVLVAIFLGLMVNAEEIVHDRKTIMRESFLNLSRLSYVHAKILLAFIIAAFQMAIYVIISNLVLEIKGMWLPFWLVLFSTTCCASIIALNLSAGIKSLVTIYISIPLILIPQILLSGTIISYNKLHPTLKSDKNVPIIADLMLSRWAYEALMVYQFKNNDYNKEIFEHNAKISDISFDINYRIPELINTCYLLSDSLNTEPSRPGRLSYQGLRNEIYKLAKRHNINPKLFKLDTKNYPHIINLLYKTQSILSGMLDQEILERDRELNGLIQEKGEEGMIMFKKLHVNEELEETLLGYKNIDVFKIQRDKIIRLYQPAYFRAESKIGRAHYFSPYKYLGNIEFETINFNLLITWAISFGLYFLLYKYTIRNIN
ncbi:MAG: ATP-binding cassette domain-containing protein [Bacteroidales bacterium]|nr:ATP-binding cassette domain-containing protein [Bacteroidales bacterium]